MPMNQTLPLHLLARPLEYRVEIAEWVTAKDLLQWVNRLRANTTARGLGAAVSPHRIQVRAGRRQPAMSDRGWVLDWLVAQHEIIDITVAPASGEAAFLSISMRQSDSGWPRFPLGRSVDQVE